MWANRVSSRATVSTGRRRNNSSMRFLCVLLRGCLSSHLILPHVPTAGAISARGIWPPQRTCSQLQFHNSFGHGDMDSPLRSGCCTSRQYRFVYVRQSGKLAGTTINSFLRQTLCAAHFRPTSTNNHTLFGGAIIPTGCEQHLRHSGILDCTCTESISELQTHTSFMVVRHPFARFISIYKFVLGEWSRRHRNNRFVGMSSFIRTFNQTYVKRDLFYGHDIGSGHWAQQMIHVVPVCKHLPNARLIPIELNVLESLRPVVLEINQKRNVSLPALPDPTLTSSRNILSYECPWQCYYELCGQACFDLVHKWYDLDIMTLDVAGIYPAPRSIADLWLVRAKFNTNQSATNQSPACELTCKHEW